ncbi:hypothetical protein [Limobrevibacterium gyesilva]|uniref:hypothetical protein n=1 Tax=Limobrevibacterium gyesilva TaxID=2991712 RepID=UPI002227A86C|nr:hypothetical protein [Limobrevibacterium gyesilva]
MTGARRRRLRPESRLRQARLFAHGFSGISLPGTEAPVTLTGLMPGFFAFGFLGSRLLRFRPLATLIPHGARKW